MNSGNLVYSVIIGAFITGYFKRSFINDMLWLTDILKGKGSEEELDPVTSQIYKNLLDGLKDEIINDFIPFYIGTVVLCYISFELLNIKENTDNRFAAFLIGVVISCIIDLDITLTFMQQNEIDTIQQITILPKIIFISIVSFLMLESFKPKPITFTRQSQYYY